MPANGKNPIAASASECPIAIQKIITEGYIYVDKTRFALELINNGKHYFLSRPRALIRKLAPAATQ